ncbi:MAG: fumarylacetoacetate hydrolase family protein, partial [Alicyclobacillus sp.]|nr:fumarylacetoacetate hydrolase family protein [Alicyclobacillus sp.]
ELCRLAKDGHANTHFLNEDRLQFGPCLPNPGKIICVGQNYRAHVDEYTIGSFDTPVLFSKYNNTIAAHGEDITLPANSTQVDYEAELAVVIGKTARHVTQETALEHVFGYCNANDLSARDLQFRTVQWLLGKTPDGFCPIGPYLVTKDEIADPQRLDIRCKLNGEIRQQSNTALMIFNIAYLISYISETITLEPGDIILTGTPEGTILGYPAEQQTWLKDGDVVTVEVEGLGTLSNRMVRR